jgi:hypothetical protein
LLAIDLDGALPRVHSILGLAQLLQALSQQKPPVRIPWLQRQKFVQRFRCLSILSEFGLCQT